MGKPVNMATLIEMSDSREDVQKKYDVFIIFTNEDQNTASEVTNILTARGLRVISQLDPHAFPPGEPAFKHILNYIDSSNTTVLILTEDSYKQPWIQFEIILTAEKSSQEGKIALRALIKGLQENQIRHIKTGLLEKVPRLKLDPGGSWKTALHDFVTNPIEVSNLLPVGCLAHGQIFSHFTGFLGYILPDFKSKIRQKAQEFRIPLEDVCEKYFILLPGSCKIQDNLEMHDEDVTIKPFDHMVIQQKTHVGKYRDFTLTLYSITKGEKTYYFVADCPKVLDAIYKLKDNKLAEVDLKFQIARFYYTLNELMNHQQNSEFNDTVEIITYNDSVQSLPQVLFNDVKRAVMLQETARQDGDIDDYVMQNLERSTRRLLSQEDGKVYQYDVVISHTDDKKSEETAQLIEDFLRAQGKTVCRETPGERKFDHLEKGKWIIFVISENFLKEDLKTFECKCALASCIHDNCLRILPVLVDDVAIRKLPGYMKFITFVTTKEPNYLENLYQKMNGDPIKMCEKMPCGDVATGLAWAYVLNYLHITLLGPPERRNDLKGRIRAFLEEKKINIGCITKMFIIVPKSCIVNLEITQQANSSSSESSVTFLGKLEPIEIISGGQHKREYYLHMFKYTNTRTGQSICFIAEYVTPCKCLYEMAHKYPFAGLEKEDMYKQADNFVSLTREIINRQAVKDRIGNISKIVDFIHFDDKEETLMSAIERKIDEMHPIVYKEGVPDRPLGDPYNPLPSFVQEFQRRGSEQ